MNNRDYKQNAPDCYYHIYNRGNAKQDIFLQSEDYDFFMLKLRQNIFPDKFKNHRTIPLPQNSFSLVCYCLMPNHFHFLLKQRENLPISKLMLRVCTSYSKYFNKKYNRIGHLFQDQFKQILIDNNDYLLWLSAYIHKNPETANIIKDADHYPWSSYSSFLKQNSSDLDYNIILDQFPNKQEYLNYTNDIGIIIKERKNIPEDMQGFLLD